MKLSRSRCGGLDLVCGRWFDVLLLIWCVVDLMCLFSRNKSWIVRTTYRRFSLQSTTDQTWVHTTKHGNNWQTTKDTIIDEISSGARSGFSCYSVPGLLSFILAIFQIIRSPGLRKDRLRRHSNYVSKAPVWCCLRRWFWSGTFGLRPHISSYRYNNALAISRT